MQKGNRITHERFTDDEYYELKGEKIVAEDKVDHTDVFWEKDGRSTWRADDWSLKRYPTQ